MNIENILKVASRLRRHSVSAPNGCIEWVGSLDENGYGHMKVSGRVERAHRVAFVVAGGALADGMKVCHRCDNPRCVNPEHLFLGTHSDNMRDMQAKGRRRGGRRRLITPAKASQVLRLRAAGYSQRAIGGIVGASTPTVSRFLIESNGASK